jgi:tetratricopeptide (TPR) repeat protein
MPKAIKKRVTKKSSLDDADVKTRASELWDNINRLISEKKRESIIAVSIAGVILLIILISTMYSSSASSKAYNLEVDAYNVYFAEQSPDQAGLPPELRLRQALELFQKSVDTKASPSALFYLGNVHFKLGDYGNAINEYNRFISKFSGEDAMLPLVYQKLASAYSMTGDNDKVVESLKKLGSIDGGIFRDSALVFEARHYAALGNDDMALNRYQELVSEFPYSMWSPEAGAKIAAANPTEEVPAVEMGIEETAPEAAVSVEAIPESPAVKAPKTE